MLNYGDHPTICSVQYLKYFSDIQNINGFYILAYIKFYNFGY